MLLLRCSQEQSLLLLLSHLELRCRGCLACTECRRNQGFHLRPSVWRQQVFDWLRFFGLHVGILRALSLACMLLHRLRHGHLSVLVARHRHIATFAEIVIIEHRQRRCLRFSLDFGVFYQFFAQTHNIDVLRSFLFLDLH